MQNVKLIKRVLSAAAKKGFIAVNYDKSTKLYLVDYQMTRQHLTFEQMYNRAFYDYEQWY